MMKTSEAIPNRMRASVLVEKGVVRMEDRPVPVPADDEVLVRVASVGVCGSDVHYYKEGRIGGYVVRSPIVLGHEVSGRIVGVGSAVPVERLGSRVSIEPQRPCRACAQCLAGRYNLCPRMEFYATPPIDGAFQDYVVIQSLFAHDVPDGVSDDAAALLEPLSVGIWACRKGQVGPGARVLIAGAGPIGAMAAQAARAFGASEVIVSDLQEARRARIMAFGATATLDPVRESTADLGADCFIDCSGATRAVQSGIASLRGGGVAVLVGMGADEIPIPIPLLQGREITLTGTFRYAGTWPVAIAMAAGGSVDLDGMVTDRFPLEEAEAAMNATFDPALLKPVVRF